MTTARIVIWGVIAALTLANLALFADSILERRERDQWVAQCIDDGGVPVDPGCLSPDAMHRPHYEGARP